MIGLLWSLTRKESASPLAAVVWKVYIYFFFFFFRNRTQIGLCWSKSLNFPSADMKYTGISPTLNKERPQIRGLLPQLLKELPSIEIWAFPWDCISTQHSPGNNFKPSNAWINLPPPDIHMHDSCVHLGARGHSSHHYHQKRKLIKERTAIKSVFVIRVLLLQVFTIK